MATLGMNVARDGSHDPNDLAANGVRMIRMVAMANIDLTGYINQCHGLGISVLLLIARESLDHDSLSFADAASLYAGRYKGLIDQLQVGNEFEHDGPSSWTLPVETVNELVAAFRQEFPDTFLIGPGMASGQAPKAKGLDVSVMDAISVHPYGQGVPPAFASPYGFGGNVGLLLESYAHFKKPIWITEWGVNTNDFEDRFDLALEYQRRMLSYMRRREDIKAMFYFCWKDPFEPGFALHESDGTPKQLLAIFGDASTGVMV